MTELSTASERSARQLDDIVIRKQVQLLYSASIQTLLLGFVAACGGAVIFWQVADHRYLLLWLGALLVMSLIRLGLVKFSVKKLDLQYRKWGGIYVLGSFFTGIVWGCFSLFLDPAWSAPYQAMLLLILTGIIAGAIPANSVYPRCFPAFFLPIVFITCLVLFAQEETTYTLFALVILIFALQVYVAANKYMKNLRNALELQYYNQDLLNSIRNRNEKLKKEILLREQVENHLSQALQKNKQIFESAGAGIFGVDFNGRVSYINPAALSLFDLQESDMLGQDFRQLMHDLTPASENDPLRFQRLYQALENGTALHKKTTQFFNRQKQSFFVEYTCTPSYRDGQLTGAVIVFSDISQRILAETRLREANKMLIEQANMDSLTGVANRRAFDQDLHNEWQRHLRSGNQITLIMMDIDQFKKFNDYYGHLGGDDCLRKVAAAMRNTHLRQADRIYRYGGEEFALILPDSSAESGLVVAERLRQSIIKQKIEHKKSHIADIVTASFGTCCVPSCKKSSIKDFILRADNALYQAKKQGSNRVVSDCVAGGV